MEPMLYWAYGSNLDREQMHARCPGAEAEAKAVLSNYALAFSGFSHRWGGAVATLVRARGARVEGMLYRVDARDLEALDWFEGHPYAYQRVQKRVLDVHGRQRRIHLYLQPEDGLVFETPPLKYFAVLRRAYAQLGFDVTPLARAAGVIS